MDSKIYGHISLRNEHCAFLRDQGAKHTLLIDGPHGFISPRYMGNGRHDIPTWNYVTAMVESPAEIIQERSEIAKILSIQLKAYDRQDVSYLDPEELAGIDQEILTFSLLLSEASIILKLKLSQNKSDVDFSKIVANLQQSGQTQLASWMIKARRFTDPKPW